MLAGPLLCSWPGCVCGVSHLTIKALLHNAASVLLGRLRPRAFGPAHMSCESCVCRHGEDTRMRRQRVDARRVQTSRSRSSTAQCSASTTPTLRVSSRGS